MAKLAMVLLLAGGLVVCGLALATAVIERLVERRFPPIGERLALGDVRLHLIDRGSGPAVVLIHGSFGNLFDWLPVVDRLQPTHRVIAVDRPGHGYSDVLAGTPTPDRQAAVLRQALHQLGIERPVLVGFSWGAAVAMAYALAWPEETAAVVSVAGALYDWPGPVDGLYRLPEVPVAGPLFVRTAVLPLTWALLPRFAANVFAPEAVPSDFAAGAALLSARPGNFRVNAQERLLLKDFLARQSRDYGTLRPPVVLLVAGADQVVQPGNHSYRLRQALPGARVIEVAGAGHNLPATRPDAVVEAVRQAVAAAGARPG